MDLELPVLAIWTLCVEDGLHVVDAAICCEELPVLRSMLG